MTGAWIFVCGPSGAGKDSVINSAQHLLKEHKSIILSRRLITRNSQADSKHDPIAEEDFKTLIHSSGLSWHWQAHGFFYGVAAHYSAGVQGGDIVIVNGSRAHVSNLVRANDIKVVEVTASTNHLVSRLQQRGRDDPQAIKSRLARNSDFSQLNADCVIINDGGLAAAGQKLATYLVETMQLLMK